MAVPGVLAQNIGANTCYHLLGQAEESTVNGIWNEILRLHFPYPHFLIAPETYNQQNRRIDLCVLQNTPAGLRPVFSYEGKHGGTANDFWQSLPQAGDYMQHMTRMSNGRRYGMLAAGQDAIVLEYSPGGQNILKVTGPNLAINNDHNTNSWDVQGRAQLFDQILGAINVEIGRTP